MVCKKPRIVIIGGGMAGLTAANKLYTSSGKDMFELCVVEGGARIGGRINTSEFGGDRIEMGATWIHGIGGSPVHQIAQKIGSLESEQPWECMDGLDDPKTIAEGGFELNPSLVDSISTLFKNLMDFAQGKLTESSCGEDDVFFFNLATKAYKLCKGGAGGSGKVSVGSFLRKGLDVYWDSVKGQEMSNGFGGKWRKKEVEEAVFAIQESIQRTYTSAGDLSSLDFDAESEYCMFPGEEITIAKGYVTIIESLASVLPPGLIELGRKVDRIEWQPEAAAAAAHHHSMGNGHADSRSVKLHFSDGSVMSADHVIVTVSLGVLKAGIGEDSGMFNPPLPSFKAEAISRLGFGVVNKLFLLLSSISHSDGEEDGDCSSSSSSSEFPMLQMAFRQPESELRNKNIPKWMRRTSFVSPIYKNSNVLISWFAGEEALELESLTDEEIINGVSTTVSSFLSENENGVQFSKVLRSKWGRDPLFLGSYSYVSVGSSGDDLEILAEPLPNTARNDSAESAPQLQILFAGEATHRTHYSTTHGAYLSGIREASRLLQHYHCDGV